MINRRAWTIDAFGNRTAQAVSGSPSQPAPQSWTGTMSTSNNNQIAKSSSSTQNWTYSASGNVTFDGVNSYLYDGEERICAVSGTFGMYGYLYDGDGDRIAKGTLTSFSCNLASNGFALTSSYVVDKDGEQAAEIQGGTPVHANVFADGKLLATYDGLDTYFALTDWLGTKRAVVSTNGCTSTYASLAYGDNLSPSGTCPDATEHHFTGKERDTESGNDYFLARYYSSTTGRFTSPDYDDDGLDPAPIPWANFQNPQSLNLFAYVLNNPIRNTDFDGNDCIVQTRTGDNAESVSRTAGDCNNVTVGDGQTKTYIPGVVDMSSVLSDHAGGITFNFTSYSGDFGVSDVKGAPMPDRPGLAYGFGNNAQYWNQLGTAGATVGSVKGVVSFYAASAAGALCALYCAEAATALPEANNAAMKATAYLESVGVPVTAKIASKLMSEATPSGKPGWGAAVKQMAHELHQIVSNYRQMQSVR